MKSKCDRRPLLGRPFRAPQLHASLSRGVAPGSAWLAPFGAYACDAADLLAPKARLSPSPGQRPGYAIPPNPQALKGRPKFAVTTSHASPFLPTPLERPFGASPHRACISRGVAPGSAWLAAFGAPRPSAYLSRGVAPGSAWLAPFGACALDAARLLAPKAHPSPSPGQRPGYSARNIIEALKGRPNPCHNL